jgi:hypothetical protein
VIARLWFCLGLLLLASPGQSQAHSRSESYSSWRIQDQKLIGIVQVDALRATQLITDPVQTQDLQGLLAGQVQSTVSAQQGGRACHQDTVRPLSAAVGQLRSEIILTCPQPLAQVPASLTIGVFGAVSLSHVHYARIQAPDGQVSETVLSQGHRVVEVGGPAKVQPSSLVDFIRLGLIHVLSGLDHIAFLLALTLLAGRPLLAIGAATGFTLGHSLTLALVTIGALQPQYSAIEALIGFTVVFAAGEALAARYGPSLKLSLMGASLILLIPLVAWALRLSALSWPVFVGAALFAACAAGSGLSGSRRMAPILAAAFGLIHGAGFAGPLIELELPQNRLLPAILGFNIGVEAAQLLALSVFALVGWLLARTSPRLRSGALIAATTALSVLGTYWFVSRSLGLN